VNRTELDMSTEVTPSVVSGEVAKNAVRAVGIVGCSASCGKTALAAGVTSVLQEQNIAARAIKPILIGDAERINSELLFLNTVSGAREDCFHVTLEFPPKLPEKAIATIRKESGTEGISIIEFPGSAAMPLSIDGAGEGDGVMTTADLVKMVDIPVILVASHGPDAFERIELSCSYLASKQVRILAIATVETNAKSAAFMDKHFEQSDFEVQLFERFRIPYLGRLKHSQSISVTIVCHGNLKDLSAECLDIMVLRNALSLPLM